MRVHLAISLLALALLTSSAYANRCESVSGPNGELRQACVAGSNTWVVKSFDEPALALGELSAYVARPANKWGDSPRNAVMLTDSSVARQWMVIYREYAEVWYYGPNEPWRVTTFTDQAQANTYYNRLTTTTRKMMELPDGLWGVAYMADSESRAVRSRASTRP